jgi:hypothetical protein
MKNQNENILVVDSNGNIVSHKELIQRAKNRKKRKNKKK